MWIQLDRAIYDIWNALWKTCESLKIPLNDERILTKQDYLSIRDYTMMKSMKWFQAVYAGTQYALNRIDKDTRYKNMNILKFGNGCLSVNALDYWFNEMELISEYESNTRLMSKTIWVKSIQKNLKTGFK